MASRYQFRQDNWSYGMSPDALGGAGSVYYANNVNLYEDRSKFTLSSAINVNSSNATGSDVLVAANIASNTNMAWIGDLYTIYTDNALSTTKVLTNNTSADRMCNCGVVYSAAGTAYGFIIHRGYVSKYTYSASASDTGVSTLTERHVTFTATGNDTYLRPYFVEGNFVYFGAGSDVKLFTNASGTFVLDTIKLEIDRGQTIVAITKIGDVFSVWATDGRNGTQYMWDGVSTEADRIIRWVDLNIQNVANFGNYDYVVCKDVSGKSYLYKASGYSRQIIRQSGYYDSPANARFTFDAGYTNAIETIGEILLVASNSSENGTNGIYGYGRKHSNYPDAATKPFVGISGTVTGIYATGQGGYYCWVSTTSGNTKRIYNWFKPFGAYYSASAGFVELNPIIGQFGEAQEKEAVKYRIGYRLPDASCSVKVYYRKDAETSYTLHKTISTASSSYGSETFPLGDKFHKIQFKIELLSSSTSYSPEVMDFTLEYQPTNNALGL